MPGAVDPGCGPDAEGPEILIWLPTAAAHLNLNGRHTLQVVVRGRKPRHKIQQPMALNTDYMFSDCLVTDVGKYQLREWRS